MVVVIDEICEDSRQGASESIDCLMVISHYCDLPLLKLQEIHYVYLQWKCPPDLSHCFQQMLCIAFRGQHAFCL